MKKKPIKILKILRRTPGGLHAWVEALVDGKKVTVKKEIKNIPEKLK